MPIRYRVLTDENVVLTEAWGTLTDRELRTYSQELLDDPDLREGFRELFDLRRVESVQATGQALRELVEFDQAYWKRAGTDARAAAIAPTDVTFGLMRMYMSMADRLPGERAVFHDAESARAWLGLEPEDA